MVCMIDIRLHMCMLWFTFTVPLSLGLKMYENEVDTNENKILPRTKEWHWLITSYDCFCSLLFNLLCIRLLPLREMRRSLSGLTISSTISGTVVRFHQNVIIKLKPPLF